MRLWIFHPLVFYPLAALAAALVVILGIQPQSWPRTPAPVSGQIADGVLVLEGAGFDSPDTSPEQSMFVVRDFWGRPSTLRIAQLPGQPPPTPAEQGVRILLAPDVAALIDERPVTIEVSYNPLQFNAASGLAVSLQGIGPAEWISADTPPEPSVVRFDLPEQIAVNAIGLRALSTNDDQAYGLEITRIRVTPNLAPGN